MLNTLLHVMHLVLMPPTGMSNAEYIAATPGDPQHSTEANATAEEIKAVEDLNEMTTYIIRFYTW